MYDFVTDWFYPPPPPNLDALLKTLEGRKGSLAREKQRKGEVSFIYVQNLRGLSGKSNS